MAVVLTGDQSRGTGIRAELEKLAAEWPERDFWHTSILVGPDSWSSRPCGTGAADIVRDSPGEMRAALRNMNERASLSADQGKGLQEK